MQCVQHRHASGSGSVNYLPGGALSASVLWWLRLTKHGWGDLVGIRRPHLLKYHQICRRGLRHCRGLPDGSGSSELRGCGMHRQTEWMTVLTDMTTYVTESRYRPVGTGEDSGVCRSFEACMQPNKLRSKSLPLVMVGRAMFCCTGGWEPFGAGRLHKAQGQLAQIGCAMGSRPDMQQPSPSYRRCNGCP